MEQKFFVCRQCGNIIAIVHASGVAMECCGEDMTELIPGTSDGAAEKHVPVVSVSGTTVTVNVGSADHPSVEAHHIEWISIHTKEGNQRKALSPTAPPNVTFALTPTDKIISAYAYCNLHKLWKS